MPYIDINIAAPGNSTTEDNLRAGRILIAKTI